MASTYNSNYFSIEKMNTGEKDGTWGDLTNNNWVAIQQTIGSSSVIDTEDITGSSSYTKNGNLDFILPDATNYGDTSTDAKARCSFITITGTGLGAGGSAPYPEFVNLNVCGIDTTTPVDRIYFIKNELTAGLKEPNTILRVYNGDNLLTNPDHVEINNGSTALVSFTSIGNVTTDVTDQLKIRVIDMNKSPGGTVLLGNLLPESLRIVQVDDLNAEIPVASVNTTRGVTDITLGAGGAGYIDGVNELTFTGGTPSSGTGVTEGTFTVAGGIIQSTNVTHRGQNWTVAPTVGLTPGVKVRAIAFVSSDSSYGDNGTYPLAFSGGSPTVPANGTFAVASNQVISVNLAYGGRGYSSVPSVACVQPGGTTGTSSVTAEISQSGSLTAVIGETSTIDLSPSSSVIDHAVIEESSIGINNPQPGKFTTLESSSSTVLGGDADDIINITGLIDGPILFSVDNDTTSNNDLGRNESRVSSLISRDITINKGDDEQVLLFKGGGSEAPGAGVNTTQVGRIITDFTDETIAMESASDWAATGGIRVKLDNTDRKAYISTNAGLTGIGTINLTAGGSGYTDGFNQAYNLTNVTNTSPCNVLYDVQFGVVTALRINYQGQGYTAVGLPDDTTDPIPGTGSGCTFTTTLGGVVDTLIGGQSQERVVPDPNTSFTEIGNYFTGTRPMAGTTSGGTHFLFDLGPRTRFPVNIQTNIICTSAELGFQVGDMTTYPQGIHFSQSDPLRHSGNVIINRWTGTAGSSNVELHVVAATGWPTLYLNANTGGNAELDSSRWDWHIQCWW